MELEKGSVRDCMTGLKRYALSMVLCITRGLAHLHSKDIVHSDLKTDNAFSSSALDRLRHLTDDFAEYWLQLRHRKGKHKVAGMEHVLLREEGDPPPVLTIANDVWAFEMTIYELLS